MGGDDGAGVDGEKTLGDGVIARGGIDPQRRTAEAGIAGLLAVEAVVRACIAGINGEDPLGPDIGSARTLADLGLATQRDGSFLLDSARLAATLKTDPQGAAAMFTNGLYGIFAAIDGVARKAGSASDPGSLSGSISRYTKQRAKLGEEQVKLAEAQETMRARLVSRFAVADTRIGVAKSTLTFLQNQIDAWNGQRG